MMNPIRKTALGLLCGCVVLTGCSKEARVTRHLERGDRYYAEKRYTEAVLEYMQVLRRDPENAHAIKHAGLSLYARGQLQQSLPFLQKSVELNPADGEVGLRLGTLFVLGGDPGRARDLALSVLNRNPQDLPALLLLSDAAQTTQDVAVAKGWLASVAGIHGTNAAYHIASGNLSQKERNAEEAIRSYRKALGLDPASGMARLSLATALWRHGQTPEAEREFRAAAGAAPTNSVASVRLAEFLHATERQAEAVQRMDETLKAFPDYIPARAQAAKFAFEERRYEDCLTHVESLLKQAPDHADALILRAQLRLARRQHREAISDLEKLVKRFPKSAQLHHLLGVACAADGNKARALAELEAARTLNPAAVESTLLLAEIKLRSGASAETVTLLEELIRTRPRVGRAYVLLGAAYRAQGRKDLAAQTYRKLVEIAPDSPEGSFLLGVVLREQGLDSAATQAFMDSLGAAPDFVLSATQLASMDVRKGDTGSAIDRVKGLMEKAPKAPGYPFLLGRLCLLGGRTNEAEQAFGRAIELQPNFSGAYVELSRLYALTGKRKEALAKLDESLAKNPKSLSTLMLKASLLQASGDVKGAREIYETMLQINPSFTPAMNNLAYVLLEHFGDEDKAFELASRARELSPGDPAVADTLGWIVLRRGDHVWAQSLLQESHDRMPWHPEVAYHLAKALMVSGAESAALELFAQAAAGGTEFTGKSESEELAAVLMIDPARAADPQALEEMRKTLEARPDSPAARVRLAAVSERLGDSEGARGHYERALKENGSYVPALLGAARLQAGAGKDPARALELAEKARAAAPNDPLVRDELGWIAYLAGRHAWAMSLLAESAKGTNAGARAMYRFGIVALANGRVEGVPGALRKGLALGLTGEDRQAAEACLGALEQAGKGTADERIAAFGAMLTSRPDELAALAGLAAAQAESGRAGEARATDERILKQYPEFTPSLKRIVIALADAQARGAETDKLAVAAREKMPSDPDVGFAVGRLALYAGNAAHAAQLMQEVAGRRPTDARVLYFLGAAQYRLKDGATATRNLTRALEGTLPEDEAADARELLKKLSP